MSELVTLGICVLGMLGAFYLGSRKSQDRTIDLPKDYDISEGEMDIPDVVTEKEYQEALKGWKINGDAPE